MSLWGGACVASRCPWHARTCTVFRMHGRARAMHGGATKVGSLALSARRARATYRVAVPVHADLCAYGTVLQVTIGAAVRVHWRSRPARRGWHPGRSCAVCGARPFTDRGKRFIARNARQQRNAYERRSPKLPFRPDACHAGPWPGRCRNHARRGAAARNGTTRRQVPLSARDIPPVQAAPAVPCDLSNSPRRDRPPLRRQRFFER